MALPYVFLLKRFYIRETLPDISVMFIIIFMTISIIAGYIADPARVNAGFYIQTLAPLAMYFVGAHLIRGNELLPRIPLQIIIINTVTILLMMTFLYREGLLFGPASTGSYNLSLVFPQSRDLYPPIYFLSIFCIIYVLFWDCRSYGRLVFCVVATAIHVLFIHYMWARAAILGAAFALIAILYFEWRHAQQITVRTEAIRKLGQIYLVMAGIGFASMVLMTGGILAERFQHSEDLQDSDLTRLELAVGAVQRLLKQPLVGHMFIPDTDVLVGGVQVDVLRLFPSHNQYLDYALRGGVQSGLLLIALVVWGIREGLRPYPARSPPENIDALRRYLGAFMIMIAVGAFFQLYFVQNLAASIVWYCLGILARLSATARHPLGLPLACRHN